MLSDLGLMELHVRALFRHDRAGRIRRVNEPPYPPVPRLFVGRTRVGAVVRWRDDGERAAARAVPDRLLEDEPDRDALAAAAGGIGPGLWVGPAYVFAPLSRPCAPPPEIVRVSVANAAVLAAHFPFTRTESHVHEPCLAVVEDGRAVAVCMSARHTAAAAEAGLHTVPAWRGRGHGSTAARAWAQAVQAEGRVALYSTAAHNLPSQAVARRLGLRPYGIDVHIG